MDETFERLRALDGTQVWVALLRAEHLHGTPVYRSGIFHLFDRPNPADNPVTRIVDADGLPLVTFRGSDMLSVVDGVLHVTLRASFRIDVLDRPFTPETPAGETPMTYDTAARILVAE